MYLITSYKNVSVLVLSYGLYDCACGVYVQSPVAHCLCCRECCCSTSSPGLLQRGSKDHSCQQASQFLCMTHWTLSLCVYTSICSYMYIACLYMYIAFTLLYTCLYIPQAKNTKRITYDEEVYLYEGLMGDICSLCVCVRACMIFISVVSSPE